MERDSLLNGSSGKISSQKCQRENEDETADRSKANEKLADKRNKSNGDTKANSGDTTKCSICLDTVNSSIMKSLPCAHVFHEECINDWLKISEVCPICRWPITADTNDSSLMGASSSRETIESSEDDYNESRDTELRVWSNDSELNEWSDNYELEETIDGNDSSYTGASTSEETFEHSEDEYDESRDSELDRWTTDFELPEGSYNSELEESTDDPESEEFIHEFELEESTDEPESEELIHEFGLEESTDESESEESTDQSKSEESTDQSESEESTDESESEESNDEFELEGWSEDDF